MSSAQPPRTLTNCPELGRRRHWKVSLRANDQGRITQLVPVPKTQAAHTFGSHCVGLLTSISSCGLISQQASAGQGMESLIIRRRGKMTGTGGAGVQEGARAPHGAKRPFLLWEN